METLHWLVPLILVALAFDFLNGFHDAANSIATVVGTRVLAPRVAVLWAAFFDMIGPLLFGTHVARTIGKGIVDIHLVTPELILAALVGAIIWNLFTWFYGIPSSSSHALVGGLVGAAVTIHGTSSLVWWGLGKTVLFIFLSPLVGFLLGSLMFVLCAWIVRRKTPFRVDTIFRRLQLVSAALYAIGHGTNDAQKTMGIIFMLLVSGGHLAATAPVPLWVILLCSVAMAAGTASGGWRIVRTMATKLTRLKPFGGFCAESSAAMALYGASLFGIPVSTTHTITGAITGVGNTLRRSSVRWGLASNIVWAWIFTIPASALLAAGVRFALRVWLGH
ncbi:MAG: inorganic phosphate transporter [Verrucomicrobiae bacterium]|nr:inorganic phosphate transporter [Verrucomicrobiae bacterium]